MLADIPIWAFPLGFLVLAAFYTNTLLERVPLYLTNRTTWAALAELLDQEKQHGARPAFVDLGCGLGGLVAYLARNKPDWDVVGVETAPGPYLIAKLRCAFIPNASVRFQSLWNTDLKAFDVAYAFLSPAPMERLLDKASDDMRAGTLFVSNSFWAAERPYDSEVQVNDGRESCLFLKRL
ncbi:class I SAM-dependent methyltransferase [Pseudomonadota bacterium]